MKSFNNSFPHLDLDHQVVRIKQARARLQMDAIHRVTPVQARLLRVLGEPFVRDLYLNSFRRFGGIGIR